MNTPIWSSLAALFFVLVIIPLSLWLFKAMSKLRPAQDGPLRVLHRISLGPREQIAVVKAGEKTILIGITSQSIHALCELGTITAELSLPQQDTPTGLQASVTSGHPFSALLQRLRKP